MNPRPTPPTGANTPGWIVSDPGSAVGLRSDDGPAAVLAARNRQIRRTEGAPVTVALRGQVFAVDLGYGRKPWVVVSSNDRNRERDSVIAARISGEHRTVSPTVVALGRQDPVAGFAVVDELVQLFRDDLDEAVGRLSPSTIGAIDDALRVALALGAVQPNTPALAGTPALPNADTQTTPVVVAPFTLRALTDRTESMHLTPEDVHNVAFNKPPIGRRGYNEDEVDDFLDIIEAELARLHRIIADLGGRP